MATVSDVKAALDGLPDDAEVHLYVKGDGATIQAEWVEDDQINNPVILRAKYDLWAAGPIETGAEPMHLLTSATVPSAAWIAEADDELDEADD